MELQGLLLMLLQLGVFGFIVWLIIQINMPALIKQVIVAVAVIYILHWFITKVRRPLNSTAKNCPVCRGLLKWSPLSPFRNRFAHLRRLPCMSDSNTPEVEPTSADLDAIDAEFIENSNATNLEDAALAQSLTGVDPEQDGLEAGQTTASTVGDVLGI